MNGELWFSLLWLLCDQLLSFDRFVLLSFSRSSLIILICALLKYMGAKRRNGGEKCFWPLRWWQWQCAGVLQVGGSAATMRLSQRWVSWHLHARMPTLCRMPSGVTRRLSSFVPVNNSCTRLPEAWLTLDLHRASESHPPFTPSRSETLKKRGCPHSCPHL